MTYWRKRGFRNATPL